MSQLPKDSNSGDLSSPGGNGEPPIRVILTGSPAFALTALCLVILSLGMVLVALFFVYLCFMHPDSANVVIPLILAPLGGLVAINGKKVVYAIRNYSKAATAIKTGAIASESTGELESNQ